MTDARLPCLLWSIAFLATSVWIFIGILLDPDPRGRGPSDKDRSQP